MSDTSSSSDTSGYVTQVPIRGGLGDDPLFGRNDFADHFDADAGGDDRLYGRSGDDVYWLGRGTGADVIYEGYHRQGAGDTGDVIRLKEGLTSADVRLERDANHLYVRLVDGDGAVTDSYQVAWYYYGDDWKIERVELSDGTLVYGEEDLAQVPIRGGVSDDFLFGRTIITDHFDGNAGGNDTLYGKGGDDVYWLGRGTGDDVIYEGHFRQGAGGDTGDVIRLKEGLTSADVRLERDANHLYVRLLDGDGAVTDSYQVAWHYHSDVWKVERVELSDGTHVYGVEDLAHAPIRGGLGDDLLFGRANIADYFDGNAGGDDSLYGRDGDDVYWLGRGTGDDVIYEGHHRQGAGDTGDVIRLKEGLTSADVRLERDANHLYVRLVDGEGTVTDSYQVAWHYHSDDWKVERVELSDGTQVWAEDFALATPTPISGGTEDAGHYGDNVYLLGRGTGEDVIDEGRGREGAGDSGDAIRLKVGLTSADVRLERAGNHLYVRLVDGDGAETDSYKVKNHFASAVAQVERVELSDSTLVYGAEDLAQAPIRGGSKDDVLLGGDGVTDYFDGDAGGNDRLRGGGGDDVYWLGRGTDNDVITEGHGREGTGDSGDVIRLKEGLTSADVRLERAGNHLFVRLVDGDGAETDSYKVKDHFASAVAQVERVELSDSTLVYGAEDLAQAPIRGGSGDDVLLGGDGVTDYFDGDAGGNDRLRGGGGDDVYWLGRGTGDDVITEGHGREGTGDSGDVIRLKEGLTSADVRLERAGNHLFVRLVDGDGAETDSYKVKDHFASAVAQVERVELSDGTQVYGAEDLALAPTSISDGPGDDDHYGDNVYLLGRGTGDDVINEGHGREGIGDAGDVIRLEAGLTSGDVRLEREGDHLYVRLLGAGDGAVTDSYKVDSYYVSEAAKVERVELSDGTLVYGAEDLDLAPTILRGGPGDDLLLGGDGVADHFDADAGGADILHGKGGDDVYWLGLDTGDDVINEGHGREGAGDTGDVIRLMPGLTSGDVRLEREGDHLYVRMLGTGDGAVTDSYRVDSYYASAAAKVERVELSDGTQVYGAEDLALAPTLIRGGPGDDPLLGDDGVVDHFDGDVGGDDTLYGKGGDDVYWLGRGTDHDVINEGHGREGIGDVGDVIKVRDYGIENVGIERNGDDLLVKLFEADGTSDNSYTVKDHFSEVAAEVESVKLGDLVFSTSNAESYISAWQAFHDEDETSEYATFQELADAYWV